MADGRQEFLERLVNRYYDQKPPNGLLEYMRWLDRPPLEAGPEPSASKHVIGTAKALYDTLFLPALRAQELLEREAARAPSSQVGQSPVYVTKLET